MIFDSWSLILLYDTCLERKKKKNKDQEKLFAVVYVFVCERWKRHGCVSVCAHVNSCEAACVKGEVDWKTQGVSEMVLLPLSGRVHAQA